MHPILFRFVHFRIKDRDLTDDIVQETFLRLWKMRAKLQTDKPILSLLLTISRRLILDYYKHNKVRLDHRDDITSELYSQNDETQKVDQHREKISKAIWIINKKLPKKCAEVFTLSRLEGLSHREIAVSLGISTKTVENHITKANRIINKYFSL